MSTFHLNRIERLDGSVAYDIGTQPASTISDPENFQVTTSTGEQTLVEALDSRAKEDEVVKKGEVGSETITATGSTRSATLSDRAAEIANIKDFGAIGDGVVDDTEAVQAAIDSGATYIFRPEGTYLVTSLNYDFNLSMWGPGKIISDNINSEQYGSLLRAGVKVGNYNPLDKHGGIIVGGEGPTPHGPLIKSQQNGSIDITPTRGSSNPIEFQLIANQQSYGIVTGDGTGRIQFERTFAGDFSNIYTGDLIWVAGTEYRVVNKIDNTYLDLLNIPGGGAASIPTGSHDAHSLYFTIDMDVDITGTSVTRVSGEMLQPWGDDHNVIIDGVRYEVTIDDFTDTFTVDSAPGDAAGKKVTYRWCSGERFVAIARFQNLGAQGTEQTFSIATRPDKHLFRSGATGDGIGRRLPFHFEGENLHIGEEDSSGAYNDDHLVIGTYHLWIDNNGRLRIKNGEPTSQTDGTIVGDQV